MKWAILLIFLFIIACEPARVSPEENYRQGTEGILFDLELNNNNELYENTQRTLSVRLKNFGATDITEDNPLYINTITDPLYLTIDPQRIIVTDLLGKSKYSPFGDDRNYILGQITAKNLLGQIESPDTNLFLSVCYPYKTIYSDNICVASSIYQDEANNEVCRPAPISDSKGQGAPIAVKSVTTELLAVGTQQVNGGVLQKIRPVFRIEIENEGKGIPYVVNHEEFCTTGKVQRKNPNKVIIKAWMDPTENEDKNLLDCSPVDPTEGSSVVQLVDGKATIYCKVTDDNLVISEYNYYATLLIELDYVYSEGKIVEFEVVKSPDYVR